MNQFKASEDKMNANDAKEEAKTKLGTFCEEIKLLFTDSIEETKEKINKHIDSVFLDISEVSPTVKKLYSELDKCRLISEMFLPISQIATLHKEITSFDKSLAKMDKDLKMPEVNKSEIAHLNAIRSSFQSIFMDFCEPQLAAKVFTNFPKADQEQTDLYVPTFFQSLRKAVVDGNIEAVKVIMENEKLPAKSLKCIFNYQFHCENDDGNFANQLESEHQVESKLTRSIPEYKVAKNEYSQKTSLLSLVAIYGRVDIFRYLISLDGADLLERYCGKTIVHHLLSTKHISEVMENLIIELIRSEPNLLYATDWKNFCILQYAVIADSARLIQFLIEIGGNLNVNFHFENGSTPLITSIRLKNKKAFDKLMAMGASPAFLALNNDTSLHEAFKSDWSWTINAIFLKNPQMLEWVNHENVRSWKCMVRWDSINAFKIVENWYRYENLPIYTVPHIDDVYSYVDELKPTKISAYLNN